MSFCSLVERSMSTTTARIQGDSPMLGRVGDSMNHQPLSDLVAHGEVKYHHRIQTSHASDLGRETCVFANATGGEIMLGGLGCRGDRWYGRPQSAEVEDAKHRTGWRIRRSRWKSRAAVRSCAWSSRRRCASPARSADDSSYATERTVRRCPMKKWKTCSMSSGASISTRRPVGVFHGKRP